MARLPRVWELKEAERIANELGPKALKQAVLTVLCTDCGSRILWVTYANQRPLVLAHEKNDRLAGERVTRRGWDIGWLDLGWIVWARCKVRRYGIYTDCLRERLPTPGAAAAPPVRVSHELADEILVI